MTASPDARARHWVAGTNVNQRAVARPSTTRRMAPSPVDKDRQKVARWLFYAGAALTSLLTLRLGPVTLGDVLLGASAIICWFQRISTQRRPDAPRPARLPAPLPLIAWIVLLGGVLSLERADSVFQSVLVIARLVFLAVVVPWQACQLLDTRERFTRGAQWWLGGAVVCAAGTLVQYLVSSTAIPGADVTNAGRYSGFTPHVSDTGGVIAPAIGAAVALLLLSRASRTQRLTLAGCILVLGIGLILCGSVSGFLAFALMMAFIILRGAFRPLRLVVAFVAGVVILRFSAAIQSSTSNALGPSERIKQVLGLSARIPGQNGLNTTASRALTDSIGWHGFLRHPIFGRGLDVSSGVVVRDGQLGVHNFVIGAAYGGGLILCIGLCIPFFQALTYGLGNARRDAAGMAAGASMIAAAVFALTGPSLFNRFFWLPVAGVYAYRAITHPHPARRPINPDARSPRTSSPRRARSAPSLTGGGSSVVFPARRELHPPERLPGRPGTTSRSGFGSDGAWSVALNALSKVQSIGTLLLGYLAAHVAGIGLSTATASAALLGATLADFGFSSEVGRFVAADPSRRALAIVSRWVWVRALAAGIASSAVLYATLGVQQGLPTSAYLAAGVYGAFLVVTLIYSNILYGLSQFRYASTLLGVMRVVAAVSATALSWATANPFYGIALYGAIEASAVPALRRKALVTARAAARNGTGFGRHYLWLGFGNAINTLVNLSDVLLIGSVVAAGTTLGVFSVASQLQNGVATLAISAALPLSIHIARGLAAGQPIGHLYKRSRRTIHTLSVGVALLVAAAYVVASKTPLLPRELRTDSATAAVCICLASAVLSSMAAVYIVVAIGMRRHKAVGLVRLANGIITVPVMMVSTYYFGLLGAAVSTVVRDASLLALAFFTLRRLLGNDADSLARPDESMTRPTSAGLSQER